MPVGRLAVLAFAAIAAIGAFLFLRQQSPAPASPVVSASAPVEAPPVFDRVLVAKGDMSLGQVVKPDDFEWRDWPADSLSKEFLIEAKADKPVENLTGAVVRYEVVAGEPVIERKFVKPGEAGFLSAVLTPGYRAVSVPISEETAAAGFIMPHDRVDVILTRQLTIKQGESVREEVRSDVFLADVRVLAIDQTYRHTGANKGDVEAVPGSVATLELSPDDVETLAKADKMGDISLVLRGLQQESGVRARSATVNAPVLDQGTQQKIEAIRIHAFGKTNDSVVTGTGGLGLFQ